MIFHDLSQEFLQSPDFPCLFQTFKNSMTHGSPDPLKQRSLTLSHQMKRSNAWVIHLCNVLSEQHAHMGKLVMRKITHTESRETLKSNFRETPGLFMRDPQQNKS